MKMKIKASIFYDDKCIQKEFEKGTTLETLLISMNLNNKYIIVAGKVNNHIRELKYSLNENCKVEFLDISNPDGNRIYQNGLVFIYIKAIKEILGETSITIEHSLSKGLYSEIKYHRPINQEDLHDIKKRMEEIVNQDIPFAKEKILVKEAMHIFKQQGMLEKVKLLKFRKESTVNIYSCGWIKDYFYGYMVPSTGYLKKFELKYYEPGIIIRFPHITNPDRIPEFHEHKKLGEIFKEAKNWGTLMNLSFVSDLNERIETDTYNDTIRVAEALHEKKIAYIADQITKEKKKIILIAGPSSSGKTTFAQRLSIQLQANGISTIAFSTDDYFVEREETPKDHKGELDYESLNTLDLKLFNQHIKELIEGKEVDVPIFNFITGHKEFGKRFLKVMKNQIIIIEGIHALNPELTKEIKENTKFKIYISALTQLNIDSHNRIPTTDTRLIRRMVRDSLFRGHSAKTTLQLWSSVRRGEEQNIFPYQENVDVMFNSALIYELAVLKKYATPLLEEIKEDDKEYMGAKRLLKFFNYFLSIENESAILNNSIIKEFIGNY